MPTATLDQLNSATRQAAEWGARAAEWAANGFEFDAVRAARLAGHYALVAERALRTLRAHEAREE